MDKDLLRFVRERADYCCEYCQLPESCSALPFHLDHVIAQQHGGKSSPENLAFACCYCNRYKGPNLTSIDPESGRIVPLFHPRQHVWEAHFQWEGSRLAAKTPLGHATIELLQINRADAVAVRELLMLEGTFVKPPLTLHEPSALYQR